MRVHSAKFVDYVQAQGVERYLNALQESLNDSGAEATLTESTTGYPCVEWKFPAAKNGVNYRFYVGSIGAWLEIDEGQFLHLLDKEVLSEKQLITLIGQSRSAAFLARRRASRQYKRQLS